MPSVWVALRGAGRPVPALVALHHVDTPFVKRRRVRDEVGEAQDGIGDARIVQGADVWRVPASLRERK